MAFPATCTTLHPLSSCLYLIPPLFLPSWIIPGRTLQKKFLHTSMWIHLAVSLQHRLQNMQKSTERTVCEYRGNRTYFSLTSSLSLRTSWRSCNPFVGTNPRAVQRSASPNSACLSCHFFRLGSIRGHGRIQRLDCIRRTFGYPLDSHCKCRCRCHPGEQRRKGYWRAFFAFLYVSYPLRHVFRLSRNTLQMKPRSFDPAKSAVYMRQSLFQETSSLSLLVIKFPQTVELFLYPPAVSG